MSSPGSGRRARRPPIVLLATALIAAAAAIVGVSATAHADVVNGTFDNGLAGWNIYPNAAVVDGWGCNDVPAGTGAYGAGLGQLVTLQPSTSYVLRFDAKLLDGSGTPGPIRAVVQLPRDPWTQYLPEQALAAQLSTTPVHFDFAFTTPATLPDDGNAELTVQQNGPTANAYRLCLDNVVLEGGVPPEPYEPDTGPRVRVNHVGYFQHGPKRATLVTEATEPVAWELHNSADVVIASGTTTPAGHDPAAGLDVHLIDFSDVTSVGAGFTLTADGETSFPFELGVDDVFDQLRYDALDYYYPARSGIAIDGAVAGAEYARPAGHVSSPTSGDVNLGDVDVPCQSVANQTDDAGNAYYGSIWECPEGYSLDVTGGWYDAGDHGKYVVNGGISVAQLLGTYERLKSAPSSAAANLSDGTLQIPESSNGVPDVLDEARWELEWMMKMQVPADAGPQLIDDQQVDVAGMLHHKIHDEGWTGLPLMPHLDPQVRSLHRPSTAATLNFAAVAAQGARLWAPYDPGFADALLEAGETAYAAAIANPAIYAPGADGGEGGGPYNDGDVTDEFYWAAAELFITTGEPGYAHAVADSPDHVASAIPPSGFAWGDVAALAQLDLANVPNELPDRDTVRGWVVAAAGELLAIQADQPMGHPYEGGPGGTYVWGSNSQIMNNIVVLGAAFDLTGDAEFAAGAMEAIDYLLGRNSLGWSYVTGYGEEGYNSVNQHSRWWAAQLDPSLPHPPPGSLSGGPNSDFGTWDPTISALYPDRDCAPQRCYVDHIQSWSTNELTVNWNAPTAWVANFLGDLADGAFEAPVAPDCTVAYDVTEFGRATIRLTNTGITRWSSWDLEWGYSGSETVTRVNAGRLLGQDGPWVTLGARGASGELKPGQTARLSLTVDAGSIPGATPELFRVGGEVCAVV
jgi:endoglucanase